MRLLSKFILKTDKHRTSSTLGSLLQCLTAIMAKKFFLISGLNLPWCSIVLFPGILSGSQREDGGEVVRKEYSVTEEKVFKKGDFSVCVSWLTMKDCIHDYRTLPKYREIKWHTSPTSLYTIQPNSFWTLLIIKLKCLPRSKLFYEIQFPSPWRAFHHLSQ